MISAKARVSWAALAAVLVFGIFLRQRAVQATGLGPGLYATDFYYPLGANLARRSILSLDGKTPTAVRAPLYPAFIASIGAWGGADGPRRVLSAQAILSGLAILLLFALGTRLHSPACGLLAAGSFALHPAHVAWAASLEIVSFYTVLIVTIAAALVLWTQAPSRGTAVLAGLSIGVSLVCRSTLFALPLLLALLSRKLAPAGRRRYWEWLLLFSFLPLAPWALRNAVVFQRFIPFEHGTAGSTNFYLASLGYVYNWSAEPGSEAGPTAPDPAEVGPAKNVIAEIQRTRTGDEVDVWMRLALDNIRREPWRYIRSSGERLWSLWQGNYLWLLAAFTGCCLGWKQPAIRVLATLALYFNIHAALTTSRRYAVPMTPVLFLLASFAFFRIVEQRRGNFRFATRYDDSLLRSCLGGALLIFSALTMTAYVLLAVELTSIPRSWERRQRAVLTAMDLASGGRPQEARALLQAEPRESSVLHALGVIDFLAGRRTEAAALFREAVSRQPLNSDARASLAATLELSGERQEAQEHRDAIARMCAEGLGSQPLCADDQTPREPGK